MPVLNDMGGSRLDVSENIASTLRAQDHGHPPIVLDRPLSSGGFCTEHSADSRGIGYEEERAPTLRAGVVPGVAIEYNPTDSRIKLNKDGICQTLCRRCGTGGNQTPLAMVPRAFGIGSDQSQGMQSENSRAGIYEAETSRTLDCRPDPGCRQGGIAVVEPIPFAQNQRQEVRALGKQSGSISAEPGIHQQTFVAVPERPAYLGGLTSPISFVVGELKFSLRRDPNG